MNRNRRRLLGAALASAGAAALGLAAVPRTPVAQELVETIDLDWHDAGRDRPVPVRLHLPRAAGAAARLPLVVFSHGIGGSRRGYSYLGLHWAAQGCASLHLQHVGSDRSLWSAGSPFALAARLQEAAQASEAIARVHDLRFALDRIFDSPWAERLDPARVAAAGHSYGANTTLLAAGARVERDGVPIDLREPRLRAAIVISAPPFYGEPAPRRILGGVQVPSLHVTSTDDVIRVPGYYSPVDDRLAVYEAIGGPRKLLAVFAGGSHSIFTDRGAPGGPVLNAQVKAATSELTTAFLRSTLLDDDEVALREWPRRHAELLARVEGFGPGA